jgi:secreted trypsin-like serine protease
MPMRCDVLSLLLLVLGLSSRPLRADHARIVGGNVAPAGAYPWIATLLDKSEPDVYTAFFCAGSLIHPYWVLTAAHCVDGERTQDLQVIVGAQDLKAQGLKRIDVVESIMHPHYDPDTHDNDVALLLLAEPVTGIEPVEIIDDPSLVQTGVMTTAMGWGAEFSGENELPSVLRDVEMPVYDQDFANQAGQLDGALTENMLVTGFDAGGVDTCQGDSGGPLVLKGRNGQWVQAGIVSWGDGCGTAGKPGAYTRVSRMRQWIQSYVWPGFAAWERAAGITPNDGPDVDGDGFTQWTEYAFRMNPTVAESGPASLVAGSIFAGGHRYPTLTVRRPTGGGNVLWGLQGTASLESWTGIDPALNVVGTASTVPGDPGAEDITWKGLQSTDRGFMRAMTRPGRSYYTQPRLIEFPGGVTQVLHTFDTLTGGFRLKEYLLTGLPAGESVTLTLRSDDFNPVLKLINADTGAVITNSNTNTGGGSDEKIVFTPAENIHYKAQVTTQTAGVTGEFTLGAFRALTGVPAISGALPVTVTGNLETTDPPHPRKTKGTFYKDDYTFTSATTQTVTVLMNAVGFYDPEFDIINSETNQRMRTAAGLWNVGRALATFTARAGVAYLVRATSAAASGTGEYNLRVAVAPSLTLGVPLPGTLSSSSDGVDADYAPSDAYYVDDYVFKAAEGGSRRFTVSSSAFDNTLEVLDAVTGAYIDYDDDYASVYANSVIDLDVQAGRSYIVRVSSASRRETGGYTVKVQ